jgi:hypothetical protein
MAKPKPDDTEVAAALWRVVGHMESGDLAGTAAVRYRLEGAALALVVVSSGGPVDANALAAELSSRSPASTT